MNLHVVMRPGKWRALDKSTPIESVLNKVVRAKACHRIKVEHRFRAIKRQFDEVKAKSRELAKKTANLMALFALRFLGGAAKASTRFVGMSARKTDQPVATGPKTGGVNAETVLLIAVKNTCA